MSKEEGKDYVLVMAVIYTKRTSKTSETFKTSGIMGNKADSLNVRRIKRPKLNASDRRT